VELPQFNDHRGGLCWMEAEKHVPFLIKRVFFIYNLPVGAVRGGHAHKELHQFLVCINGSLSVDATDGEAQAHYSLDRPSLGLYIPPMVWSTELDFVPGSVCLAMASDHYNEDDYLRNFDAYLAYKREQGK